MHRVIKWPILDVLWSLLFIPETDFIYYPISPHCPKLNKKSMWEWKTIFFVHETSNPAFLLAAARGVKLWSLNANLFFNPFIFSFAKKQFFYLTDRFSQDRHKNVENLNLVHTHRPSLDFAIAVLSLSFCFSRPVYFRYLLRAIFIFILLTRLISCANGNVQSWSDCRNLLIFNCLLQVF